MNTQIVDDDLPTSVFTVRSDLSSEDALVNASELLASVSAMANEQAFSSSGTQRLQTFRLAQLISAHLLVNDALKKRTQ